MNKRITFVLCLILTAFCLGGCLREDKNDFYKVSRGTTPKIMYNYEQKVLKALKSPNLWKKSGLPYRKVSVDTGKPISHGLRPERKHHTTGYYKIPVLSDSAPYLFIKTDVGDMTIVSEDKIDTRYFVNREDLKIFEAKAFEALKSPAIWEKAGVPFMKLQPDPQENHESRYFVLTPGDVTNKLTVVIKTIQQFGGDSAIIRFEFDLDTGKLLGFDFSEISYKQRKPLKTFSGKIEES